MKQHRIVILLVLVWAIASSGVEKTTIRITVLESETQSVALSDSGVPRNCDPLNYDAYCHSSKTTQVTNTLQVQEGNQEPFRVSCAVEAKWSRCVPLQKGVGFDARREKNGLLIYYLDEKGKLRKQLYTYVGGEKPAGETIAPATSTAGEAKAPPATADSQPEVQFDFDTGRGGDPGGREVCRERSLGPEGNPWEACGGDFPAGFCGMETRINGRGGIRVDGECGFGEAIAPVPRRKPERSSFKRIGRDRRGSNRREVMGNTGRDLEVKAVQSQEPEQDTQSIWDRIAESQEFQDLMATKKMFIVPAFVFFVLYYFALPVLVGYAPHFMSTKVIGQVNLAYLFALSQFFVAWLIAWLYVKAASDFDRLSKDIIEKNGKGGK